MCSCFKTLVVIFVLFFVQTFAIPAFGCSKIQTGTVTGGACSIKELQNLETIDDAMGGSKLQIGEKDKGLKNLRPVRQNLETPKKFGYECVLGLCLQQSLFRE